MMVDVYMKDGRTVFRFKTRGAYVALCRRNADKLGEEPSITCWARWEVASGFVPARVQ